MGYVAFAMLVQFLDNQVFYWATACSGTESPHWVFQCLSQMDEFNVTFRHIYAAEWEASKRAWILSQTRPTHLFKDIFDITRETAHCFVEGVVINVKTRCHNKTTDMFLAGFSCKTVSALSNDAEQRRASISDYCGTTGLTFWGVVMVLCMTKPSTFILENVEGLMRHNLHLLVVEKLISLGYVVLWRLCDAKHLGFPQHRPRIWFIGWRADLVPCISSFQRRMTVVMEDFFVDHPPMDLEQFLFREDHPVRFQDVQDDTSQSKGARKKNAAGSKWVARVDAKYKKKGISRATSHWHSGLAEVFPEYERLPERCRTSLDLRGVRFPEPEPMVVRLDQSEPGVAWGYSPCVTPTGMYWAGHQCRSLRGYECIALQGCWLVEEVMEKYSSTFLQHLAGTAFHVANASVFIILGLVGLADAKKERDMASPDAVAQIPSFHPSVHTDSSDSEHGGSEHGGDAEQEWLGHGGPEHGGDAD